MKLLLIDACPRSREVSRTWGLAQAFWDAYEETYPKDTVQLLRLANEPLVPFSEREVLLREKLIDQNMGEHPMFRWAKDFAEADGIVIAAPYWDLSFPAILKVYIENIYVRNLTFRYTDEGNPIGLCRAKKIVYLTTAGSPIGPEDWGYGYIQAVAKMLGIGLFERISAEGIDIKGWDTEGILRSGKEKARRAAKTFWEQTKGA